MTLPAHQRHAPPSSAVILAAGDGSRIRPISERTPKAALPVGNRPLILHHVDTAVSLGIRDIAVVVGAGGDILRAIIDGDAAASRLNVRYIEQRERHGIAHAVACAEPLVDGSFVLLLADVFMPDHRTRYAVELFNHTRCAGVLGAKEETDPALVSRNFSIELRGEQVARVVEKPSPALPFRGGLKGVGIYVFTPAIFDAIRKTPRSTLRNEYEITDAVQVLVDSGADVRAAIVTRNDINVNDAPSLLRANLALLKHTDRRVLLGEHAAVDASARLDRVVAGRNARVGAGVSLKECLLLDNASVLEPGEYTARIFGPGFSIAADAPAEAAPRP